MYSLRYIRVKEGFDEWNVHYIMNPTVCDSVSNSLQILSSRI